MSRVVEFNVSEIEYLNNIMTVQRYYCEPDDYEPRQVAWRQK